jgi:hypothetical protein
MYLALSTTTGRVVPLGAGTVTFCTGTSTAFRRDTFTRLRVFHVAFTASLQTDDATGASVLASRLALSDLKGKCRCLILEAQCEKHKSER